MAEKSKELPKELTEDLGSGPGILKRLLYFAVLIFIVILALAGAMCLKKVKPTEVGLRIWNANVPGLGQRTAVNADILDPGYNLIVPYLHSLVKYDKTIQKYEMTNYSGPLRQPDDSPLLLMTSEGNQIWADITILYYVDETKANLVRENYSTMEAIRTNGIQAVGKNMLIEELGKIERPEDFYNSAKRTKLADTALEKMRKYFGARGIEIVDVLIRDFWFTESYETEILRKTLTIQINEVMQVITEASAAQAKALQKIAEAEAVYEQELARGTSKLMQIEAEADAYKVTKNAEGDKAILQARAVGMEQMRNALSGAGGQVYVGLEFAKTLDGLNMIVLPSGKAGLNPFDVNSTLQLINAGTLE